MKKFLVGLPLIFGMIALPAKTSAHTMQTNYLFADELEFQTTYSTDEVAKNAEVIIFAPNDLEDPWLETRTDEEGRFSFMPDTAIPGDWEVEIIDEGHGEILIVPVTEEGVDFENISHDSQQDLHYSSTPMNPFHSLLITAGVGALWFTFLRKI